jgi:hypothetical protein
VTVECNRRARLPGVAVKAQEVFASLSAEARATLTDFAEDDSLIRAPHEFDPAPEQRTWDELYKAGLVDSDYSYEGPEDGGWVGGEFLTSLGKEVAALCSSVRGAASGVPAIGG